MEEKKQVIYKSRVNPPQRKPQTARPFMDTCPHCQEVTLCLRTHLVQEHGLYNTEHLYASRHRKEKLDGSTNS